MNTRVLNLAVTAFMLAGAGQVAKADIIPYPTPGTPNLALYNFTASGTGPITAYFVSGASASYDNEVGLSINGGPVGVFGLPNHSTAVGQSLVLGNANAGDQLTFVLRIIAGPPTVPQLVYSDPLLNVAYDGASPFHQHVYSTPYTASPAIDSIPVGTYVGFEDLSAQISNFNYDDETFVFTNVSVPEPSTYLAGVLLALPFGLNSFRSLRSRVRKA